MNKNIMINHVNLNYYSLISINIIKDLKNYISKMMFKMKVI